MSIRDQVRTLGAALEPGETYRGSCPACSKPKVFTVTRTDKDELVYNCYRATCDLRPGAIGGTRYGNLLRNRKAKKSKIKPYEGRLEDLSDEWKQFLYDRLGFTRYHLELARPRYAPDDHRIAYPILAPSGSSRGFVLRTYTLGVEPKAITYPETEEQCLSWYTAADGESGEASVTVIVEDIPSAIRAAQYISSVAMNSGGIGMDAVMEIREQSPRIVWAFDEDATRKAIEHHRKYSIFFEDSRVLPLEKDLKDMQEEELCGLLENVNQ